MLPTGTLVWAKQQGSPQWPAMIFPNSCGKTKKMTRKLPMFHVVFLNYKRQHAWISQKNITEFIGPNDYKTTGGSVKAAETAFRLQSMDIEERVLALNAAEENASSGSREEFSDKVAKINKSRSNIKLMRVNGSWATAKRKSDQSTHDDHDSENDNTEQDKGNSAHTLQDKGEESARTQQDKGKKKTENGGANKPDEDTGMAGGQEAQRLEPIRITLTNVTIEIPQEAAQKILKSAAKMMKNVTKLRQ